MSYARQDWCCEGLRQEEEAGQKPRILDKFETLLTSLLRHSTGTPLHLIVITEERSRQVITNSFFNVIGSFLSHPVIGTSHRNIDD